MNNDSTKSSLKTTAPNGHYSQPYRPLRAQLDQTNTTPEPGISPDPDNWKDFAPAPTPGGLSSLVEKCLGKPLDKFHQFSNWDRRPLKPEQVHYAG